MKNLLILILVSLLMWSCTTQRKCSKKFPPEVTTIIKDSIVMKDTVIYKEIIREIPIYLKADTVFEKTEGSITNNFFNAGPIYAENDYSKASAWVIKNVLGIELTQNDTTLYHQISFWEKETVHWRELYEKEITKEVHPIKERYIPWWIWTLFGMVSVIAFIFGGKLKIPFL